MLLCIPGEEEAASAATTQIVLPAWFQSTLDCNFRVPIASPLSLKLYWSLDHTRIRAVIAEAQEASLRFHNTTPFDVRVWLCERDKAHEPQASQVCGKWIHALERCKCLAGWQIVRAGDSVAVAAKVFSKPIDTAQLF